MWGLGGGQPDSDRYESLFCRNRDRENWEFRNFRFFNLKFRILANFGKSGNNFFGIFYFLLKVRYSYEAKYICRKAIRRGDNGGKINFLHTHLSYFWNKFCISVKECPTDQNKRNHHFYKQVMKHENMP